MNAIPSLHDVQRAWRTGITNGDCSVAASHVLADAISPGERLAIYRNTGVSTLVNALRLAYPAVRKIVGEEFFDGASHFFLAQHWAQTVWLDEYGAEFPDFLRAFDPVLAHPPLAAYLPDVATIERAVNHALHAPDAAPLDPRALAALPPADMERLQFRARPSLGLVRAATPADAIWSAVLEGDDDAMRAIDLDEGPVHLLVEWRDDADGARIHVERMSEAAWRFTGSLCAGVPLRLALRDSAAFDAGFPADSALAAHLGAGRFSGFAIEP